MIIIIKDGYDVIDNRPEAEIAQSERDYFEERYNRDFFDKIGSFVIRKINGITADENKNNKEEKEI